MRDPFQGKRWWVVGASHGLGAALARQLVGQGAQVVLSARSRDKLDAVAQDLGGAEVVPMDVTDTASVDQAVAQAGQVDALLWCVGNYEPLATRDWDTAKVEAMFDVNLMGAVRLLGRVVPEMAARDAGHVVIIGSLSGFRSLPGAIGYDASKAGLMHLAGNLHADLHKTNVTVQLANPGFIKTRLSDKNDFDMPQIMAPEKAADHVMGAIRSGRFQTSFPRPFSWLFTSGWLIPRRLFLRIIG